MLLGDLRARASEGTAKLHDTRFSQMVPQLESRIGFLGKINPEHKVVEGFVRKEYESIIGYTHEMLDIERLFAGIDLPRDETILRGDDERAVKSRLVQDLVLDEVASYARRYGFGKVFVPHSVVHSAANSRKIIEGKTVDIGLSVEPEGCGY